MRLVRWLAHVFRATFWFAINLAIVTGLFILSAHFATLEGEDRNGLYFFRAVASIWLFAASWSFVVSGIFRRPPRTADKKKLTRTETVNGILGCFGRLALIAVAYVLVGQYADWAYAGLKGNDPAHPARQIADRAMALATRAAERPDLYGPYVVGTLIGIVVFYAVASMLAAPRPMSAKEARQVVQRAKDAPAFPGKRMRKQQRPDVAAANDAALAAARKHGAASAAGSAAAVGAAHAGAHRTEPAPPHPDHLFGKAERSNAGSRHGGREDAVLGALTWSSSDGAWWARRDGSEQFAVRIEGDAEGPTTSQIDLARAVVQRSFEALLRASEAARPAALAKGVGLPRFTIVTAIVGGDDGPSTPVTLHLRCDGDPKTDYVVRSTDHLHTFKA